MKNILPLAGAVAAGFIVWVIPPVNSGNPQLEAWDDPGYYFPAIFAAGFVAGVLMGRIYLVAAFCVLGGQLAYFFIFFRPGPFGPIGAIAFFVFWPITLLGSYLGFKTAQLLLRRLIKRPKKS